MSAWDVVELFMGWLGGIISPVAQIASKPWFWAVVISVVVLAFGFMLLYPALKWLLYRFLCLWYGGGC